MIPVLIGLGAIVGGYLVVTNWQEIEGWLKDFLPKLQNVLKETGIVDYAAKLFSSVEGNVMQIETNSNKSYKEFFSSVMKNADGGGWQYSK